MLVSFIGFFSTGTSDKFRWCDLFFYRHFSHPPPHYLDGGMTARKGLPWRQRARDCRAPAPWAFSLSRGKNKGALRPRMCPEGFLELDQTSLNCLCCVTRLCLPGIFQESEGSPALLPWTMRDSRVRT